MNDSEKGRNVVQMERKGNKKCICYRTSSSETDVMIISFLQLTCCCWLIVSKIITGITNSSKLLILRENSLKLARKEIIASSDHSFIDKIANLLLLLSSHTLITKRYGETRFLFLLLSYTISFRRRSRI